MYVQGTGCGTECQQIVHVEGRGPLANQRRRKLRTVVQDM